MREPARDLHAALDRRARRERAAFERLPQRLSFENGCLW